jgi:hypothetical protein
LTTGVNVAFIGTSAASFVGVSRRRRERRTVDGVAGDIGAGEVADLVFRLGVGLDGVQRFI